MHPEGGRILIGPFIGLVLMDLRAGIWWGLPMLILGSIQAYRFFPGKEGL